MKTFKKELIDLTTTIKCRTKYGVESITISNADKRAIVILNEELNRSIHIEIYDMNSNS